MSEKEPDEVTIRGKVYVRAERLDEWTILVDGKRVEGYQGSEAGRQAALDGAKRFPGAVVQRQSTPYYVLKPVEVTKW